MDRHRKSIRLAGYDYSEPGFYFVTICAQDRKQLFGKINNGEMFLNLNGRIVRDELLKTNAIRPNVRIDEWIVMPDHIHFIVEILNCDSDNYAGADRDRDADRRGAQLCAPAINKKYPLYRRPRSLSSFVAQFKSTTTRYIRMENGWYEKIWQRNYYERIIRNERELHNVRKYIRMNPERLGSS